MYQTARVWSAGCPNEATSVSRLAVLGEACSIVRRPLCPTPHTRTGTGGAWRSSYWTYVYWGQFRRLSLPRNAPGRFRDSTDRENNRRRSPTIRCVDYRGRALRAARQQTAAHRDSKLPPVFAAGIIADFKREGRPCTGQDRFRYIFGRVARERTDRAPCRFPFWAQYCIPTSTRAVVFVSPKPTKHVNRKTNGLNVGRCFRTRQSSDRIWAVIKS